MVEEVVAVGKVQICQTCILFILVHFFVVFGVAAWMMLVFFKG